MGKTSLIIEGKIDGDMIQIFQELRQIRLEVLREQLKASSIIASKFGSNKMAETLAEDEIKSLLTEKIDCLEERLHHGNAIYADELDLFMDLIGGAERA